MVNKKITDMTELTSIAPTDAIVIVDVSDNTDDPAGTNKKVLGSNIVSAFDMDDITDGSTYVKTENNYTDAEVSKLSGIEALAEVNNISDVNATDLTDAGDSALHYHATDRARANHTGTQTASTISDFDTEVSNNTDVDANTTARHVAVTVSDSSEIDFTLTGQDITASLIAASIDETKLDTSVNASLDLADSAMQDLVDDTTPTLGGNLDCSNKNLENIKLAEFNDWVDNGNSGAADTIDFTTGNFQKSTLTAAVTYTFTDPIATTGVARLGMKIVQDVTGGRDITWPGNVTWDGDEPVWTDGTNGQIIHVTFIYDAEADEYIGQATGWLTY